MSERKKPGLLEQNRADVQTTKHDESIPQPKQTVKRANWLKAFHVRTDLTSAEIVETIRLLFPGFDKSLLSKCESPERYGIQLTQRAMHLLKAKEAHDE